MSRYYKRRHLRRFPPRVVIYKVERKTPNLSSSSHCALKQKLGEWPETIIVKGIVEDVFAQIISS